MAVVCKVVSISNNYSDIFRIRLVDGNVLEVDAGVGERVGIEVVAPDAEDDREVFG